MFSFILVRFLVRLCGYEWSNLLKEASNKSVAFIDMVGILSHVPNNKSGAFFKRYAKEAFAT